MRKALSVSLFVLTLVATSASAGVGVWTGPFGEGGDIRWVRRSPGPDGVYFAETTNGLYKSAAPELGWESSYRGIGTPFASFARRLFFDASSGAWYYAHPRYGRLFKSDDDGENWAIVDNAPAFTTCVNSRTIAFAASASGRLYMSDCAGDLHASADAGATWQTLPRAWAATQRVWSIGVNAGAPSDVFVGTANIEGGAQNANVMYRSVDQGTSWATVPGAWGTLGSILRIEFAPGDPSRGVALTFTPNRLYETIDGGATWVGPAFPNPTVTDFSYEPGATGRPWVATSTVVFRPNPDNISWSPLPNPPRLLGATSNPLVTAIAFGPDHPAVPLVTVSTRGAGLFATADDGASWTRVNEGVHASGNTGTPGAFLAIDEADPARRALLQFSTGGTPLLQASSDGGASFAGTSMTLPPLTIAYSAFYVPWEGPGPTLPSRIGLAGGTSGPLTPPGVYFSDDDGASWTLSSVGLASGSGRLARGATTIPGSAPPGGGYRQSMLAGIEPVGVYRSDDGGTSWSLSSTGLPYIDPAILGTPAQTYRLSPWMPTVSPADPSVAWVGTSTAFQSAAPPPAPVASGVYLSEDGGLTWQQRSNGIPLITSPLQTHATITQVVPEPFDANRAWATAFNSVVGRTTDRGLTWTQDYGTGLPSTPTRLASISFDPTNPNAVFATSFGAVYRSADNGASWAPMMAGIEGLQMIHLAFDAVHQRAYASNGAGYYQFDVVPDGDLDGVPDSAEAAAPGNGDANGDGTPDAQQANVASAPIGGSSTSSTASATSAAKGRVNPGYVTVTVSPETVTSGACNRIASVRGVPVSSAPPDPSIPSGPPAGYRYGLVSFEIPSCSAARIQMRFHGAHFGGGPSAVFRFYGTPDPIADAPPIWFDLAQPPTVGSGRDRWNFVIRAGERGSLRPETTAISVLGGPRVYGPQ